MYMCMALFRESRVFIGFFFFFLLTSHFSVHFFDLPDILIRCGIS